MIKTKREYLITENMGLVYMAAKKFIGRNMEYEDIIQAGFLGLIKAAERFDESLGFKFSTYAVPMIIGEIKGLFRYGTEIKVPRDLRKLSFEIMRESEIFERREGRSPKISEISKIMNIPEEKAANAVSVISPLISFESSEAELIKEESKEEKITERLALKEIYSKLPSDEQKLIYLRFKLNKTQKEVAEYFGISQMQVSRREKKILLYLRGVLCE